MQRRPIVKNKIDEPMKKTANIACVMRSGGIYTKDWVYKLYRGVTENSTSNYRFVCLSDIDIPGIETIPLKHKWHGWWSKIELFRPDLFSGTTVYVDLDSIVLGDMDNLIKLHDEDDFIMLKDWGKGSDKIGYQSSLMMWNGDWSVIYSQFKKNPKYYMDALKGGKGGDQVFIPLALNSIGLIPKTLNEISRNKLVASYKNDKCHERPPDDSIIVTFHGKSKYERMERGWAKEKWRLSGWNPPTPTQAEPAQEVKHYARKKESNRLIPSFLRKMAKIFSCA